jgi:enoyl-CoA hydratase/carnithine racemase
VSAVGAPSVVALSVERGIGTITMQRPPANAYDAPFLRELGDAVRAVRDDDTVRVVVIRSGTPKFFCSGADISTLRGASKASFANFVLLAHETVDMIARTPKLFIAAIEGHCIGGGLELALACDFRVAAEGEYKLGLAEVKLGLSPGMGGTQRLPRLIGKSAALQLMVTGDLVSPGEAHELGIVDQLVAGDDFAAEANAYARKFVNGATLAQGHIKLAVNEGLDGSLDQGLAIERAHQSQLFTSADLVEGLAAFGEKRPPRFAGR